MPLLDTFTAAPEALAFIFPGPGALAAHAPRVHGGVAQALAAARSMAGPLHVSMLASPLR
jgi:hypothetical protein